MRFALVPGLICYIFSSIINSLILPTLKTGFPSRSSAAIKPLQTLPTPYPPPLCFTPEQIPIRGFAPTEEDCRHAAAMFEAADSPGPPLIFSFAEEGRFPPGSVDFIVPITKRYGTCRAGATMDKYHRTKKGYAFMFEFALATEWVQSYCSTRGNLGGAVRVGEGMVVMVYGMPRSTTGESTVRNITVQDELDNWTNSLLRNSLAADFSENVATSSKAGGSAARMTLQHATAPVSNTTMSGSIRSESQSFGTS
ncbi:MAG: hypothetical protein Q9217_000203 [Psora testacea]